MPTVTQLLERGQDEAVAPAAPGRKPLTYVDLRRHVAMEIEALVGSVAEMGRLVGVATPTLDVVLAP
jgi:2-dehydropantoate 2-reductase